MKIILASASPRRKEILGLAGFDFTIDVSNVDEVVEYNTISEMSMNIAKKKTYAVFKRHQNSLVIGADTIVLYNNKVLEKPKSIDEARDMITLLQGHTHQVYTSVVLKSQDKEISFLEITDVKISKMEKQEIEDYINTSEPYDKAGGYAIQGIFSKYVKSIKGDYYNVMGLPIHKVFESLKQFNIL